MPRPHPAVRSLLAAVFAACCFAPATIAEAQRGVTAQGQEPASSDWAIRAGVLSDVPVDVAAKGTLEMPFGLRLSTSLGVMPAPYVSLINSVATSAGWYDDATADLIESTLKTSLVWRTHAGWAPFRDLGLYVEVGYGLVTLGGSATSEEIVAALTGAAPPATEGGGTDRTYSVSSTLHMLDVEVGYVFDLGGDATGGWYLQAALGFAGTLGSSTTVSPEYTPRAPKLVERFSAGLETYLNDTYQSYVFTPVLSLGGGYRFRL